MSLNYRKDFSYAKLVPTLVNDNVSALSEIARWVLERNDLQFIDCTSPPGFSTSKVNKTTGKSGFGNNPALINTDALVYTPESIIRYLDRRNEPENRLFPEGENGPEVQKLFQEFVGPFNKVVCGYLYAQLLSDRKNSLALFKQKLGFWGKLRCSLRFGHIKKSLDQQFGYKSKNPEQWLAEVQPWFEKISQRLKGSKSTYLVGDQLTAADIAFSAVAGRLLIPMEYGAAITNIEDISTGLREEVFKLRATEVGQFAFRVYQQDRPQPDPEAELPQEPGFIEKLIDRIKIALGNGQSGLFAFLAKRIPVLRVPFVKLAVVSRADVVRDLLDRNLDFTVEEINGKKMANQNGAFYLGFDANNPQFARERKFVRSATRSNDLNQIRDYVRKRANEVTASDPELGKLDVVQTLNSTVLVGLLEDYFGVTSPSVNKMVDWCSSMFYDLFLNLTNDKDIHEKALESARARRRWLLDLIAERKEILRQTGKLPDTNILNRLILQQKEQEKVGIWFDDEMIRRNIGGLLTGIMATTSKAVVFSLQELFGRPDDLKAAIKAAHALVDPVNQKLDQDVNEEENKAAGRPGMNDWNDATKAMYGFIAESLRFNPVQPGVIRYSENEQFLQGANGKQYKIKAKSKCLTLTSGAMFTESLFPNPKLFDPQRVDQSALYMNWGYALHRCYGNYINMVTIPEIVAAVLRLPNVCPAKGRTGRGPGLEQGPFPTNYVVQFG